MFLLPQIIECAFLMFVTYLYAWHSNLLIPQYSIFYCDHSFILDMNI